MSPDLAFDAALCLLIVGVAAWTVSGAQTFASIVSFIVYGLLLAIAWVRLGAPDVALAEAAIGAGLTGVLLLSAAASLRALGPRSAARAHAPVPFLLSAALAAGLGLALLELARPHAGLAPLVAQNLAISGADNPVTAVLLNFRGYDTLLESVVLLAALIAVWSLTDDAHWGGRPGLRQHVRPDGVLAVFGRLLPPIGLVVGIYVVWIGTSAPGGAFQAGTILAAVWLLAILAGAVEPPPISNRLLRWALAVGPLAFLGVGLAPLLAGGPFLSYPPAWAKTLVLTVELALTLSIAATLALLVAGRARRRE